MKVVETKGEVYVGSHHLLRASPSTGSRWISGPMEGSTAPTTAAVGAAERSRVHEDVGGIPDFFGVEVISLIGAIQKR